HLLRYRNQRWARRIGLNTLTGEEWVNHFGRFQPLPENLTRPLALRYHGHQFGVYNPYLGDGRGFLFAQMRGSETRRLLDLGTKGSGKTPWSREGDGRLTLNGGLREVLATEMLEALGVETSKSFSLIETGEPLMRGDEPSPTRSSVLVRLSHSHIRIGTFQRFAHLNDTESLRALLDHSIRFYMPEIWDDSLARRALRFLGEVSNRVARMGAQWMAAGFAHGVLNSDNINITGESFDYGPWRFLPAYDPEFTAAYFDQGGRYAYGRQPSVLLWNLTRLAECLEASAAPNELTAVLQEFQSTIQHEFAAAVTRRLGLSSRSPSNDLKLANELFSFMRITAAPFEQIFFDLHGGLADRARMENSPAASVYRAPEFAQLRRLLAEYQPMEGIDLDHRYFRRAVPCTMLIEEVQSILEAIRQSDDWSPFEAKLTEIAEMADAYSLLAPQQHAPEA
ncbi:MAG TPA: YdiU family protein, partial [Micropepsaceae bacterium]|nr:YdiU family protein [Micropepsaceae bacterium]